MNYYRKHIGDYHRKAGRLSLLQHGVYNVLLDAMYEREKFPTRAEAIEWTWASTLDEISCVDFLLARFFEAMPDGRFVQRRVEEELERYWEFCRKQAEKSGKGVKAKRAKNNPPEFDLQPDSDPAGSKKNPGTTLETSNQEPVTSKKTTTSSGPSDTDRCPTGRIIELYREHARSLVQPRVVTDATKAQIAARWRQAAEYQNREFWTGFFQQCEASDFLSGRAPGRDGGKPFKAGLEWIVKAANFAKIVNGNYENQEAIHAQGRRLVGQRPTRSDRADELYRQHANQSDQHPEDADAGTG